MQFLDTKRVLNPNGDCGFLAFLGDLAWLLDYKAIYYCISLGNAVFVVKFVGSIQDLGLYIDCRNVPHILSSKQNFVVGKFGVS